MLSILNRQVILLPYPGNSRKDLVNLCFKRLNEGFQDVFKETVLLPRWQDKCQIQSLLISTRIIFFFLFFLINGITAWI